MHVSWILIEHGLNKLKLYTYDLILVFVLVKMLIELHSNEQVKIIIQLKI